MSATDLQQLEENIRHADGIITEGKCLDRLYNNLDFKTIVLEGYFKKEAVRLVHLKADPAMQDERNQKNILAQIDAIGTLKAYFHTLGHRVSMAEKNKANDEETLEYIRAGGEV